MRPSGYSSSRRPLDKTAGPVYNPPATRSKGSLAHRILRNTAAALLQTNRPVPQRSDAEITAEMEANYRWNFAVNVLDGAGFLFGISFISSSTMAPLYISKLTTSPLAIGLVAVIA